MKIIKYSCDFCKREFDADIEYGNMCYEFVVKDKENLDSYILFDDKEGVEICGDCSIKFYEYMRSLVK